LVGLFEPLKGLTIDARYNMILEQVKNRPMVSDGAGNANYNVMFLPTSINVNDLKPWKDDNGKEILYNSGMCMQPTLGLQQMSLSIIRTGIVRSLP
jgi:nitrate reductase alpha subunit